MWRAPKDLWWHAVVKLTADQLDEILPGVPHAQDVELSDLTALLDALGEDARGALEDLRVIGPVPEPKMDFNKIPAANRLEFNEGRLLEKRIRRWFAEQDDPGLRDAKAARFKSIYLRVREAHGDPGEIVEAVYVALGGADFRLSSKRATAVYAVTAHFFDSCDIFEEPSDGGLGGEPGAVAH